MIDFRPAPASLPAGQRIYAVGDVHGCADRLRTLHQAIAADLAARPAAETLLLHIGDYIDRGPDTAGVIEMLRHGPPLPGAGMVNLMGNHEDMLLTTLAHPRQPDRAAHWLDNGGGASLASWGLEATDGPAAWQRQIPAAHLEFLRSLALRHTAGGYLFVHAGVRPGVPLDRQSTEDLLWIREPFLSYGGDFGAVVVHGHTPIRQPAVRPNRVGIDTGAVMGGRLTCGVFEADRVGFIDA
jgi:serine/threonine protein phosphatase 1